MCTVHVLQDPFFNCCTIVTSLREKLYPCRISHGRIRCAARVSQVHARASMRASLLLENWVAFVYPTFHINRQ